MSHEAIYEAFCYMAAKAPQTATSAEIATAAADSCGVSVQQIVEACILVGVVAHARGYYMESL